MRFRGFAGSPARGPAAARAGGRALSIGAEKHWSQTHLELRNGVQGNLPFSKVPGTNSFRPHLEWKSKGGGGNFFDPPNNA